MDIPSISVNRHDRYTPDLRDKIAQALGAPPAEGYHVLTPPLLRELADTVSERAPILSLYIQLTPERRVGGAWRSYLSSLSEALLRPVQDKKICHALEQEIAQVCQAMGGELPVLGRGAAFFSCRTWPVAADCCAVATARRCLCRRAPLYPAARALSSDS
jgi:hypothetical protein